jgi:hypothetical protein
LPGITKVLIPVYRVDGVAIYSSYRKNAIPKGNFPTTQGVRKMATILNVTELAETLDTTPRTARKFLRSVTPVEEQPGKGGRWQIKKADVRSLAKKFKEYQDEHMRTPEVPEDDESEVEAETE